MRYAFKKARALRINNLETDELEVRLVDLKTVTSVSYTHLFPSSPTHMGIFLIN